MIYFANIRRSGGMVDTKDSKSFVSDGVRVQVSSPVEDPHICEGHFFLNFNPAPVPYCSRVCGILRIRACEGRGFFRCRQGRQLCGQL